MRDAGDFARRVVDIRNAAKEIRDRDQLIGDPIAVAIRIGEGCCITIGIDNADQQSKGREVGDRTGLRGDSERSVDVLDECVVLDVSGCMQVV